MGNAAKVQGIYEAFGRGDVPAILAQLSEDVAWDVFGDPTSAQIGGVPWLTERAGREGARDFFSTLEELEFHAFQPLELIADGDKVAALIAFDVTVRATGYRFRDEGIHLWTFGPDGLVSAYRHYVDTGKHLAAVAGRPAAERVGAG